MGSAARCHLGATWGQSVCRRWGGTSVRWRCGGHVASSAEKSGFQNFRFVVSSPRLAVLKTCDSENLKPWSCPPHRLIEDACKSEMRKTPLLYKTRTDDWGYTEGARNVAVNYRSNCINLSRRIHHDDLRDAASRHASMVNIRALQRATDTPNALPGGIRSLNSEQHTPSHLGLSR